MNVGIFGGSFDPIHEGHIRLAKYVLDHTDLDEIWLMVSPLNPLKPQGYVASDEQRLAMARLAVQGIPGIHVSDFEFHLPIPSYTYKTLTELKKSYPHHDFRLIIGGDNWASFDRWRNPEEILRHFGVIVYPRPGEILSDISETDTPSPAETLPIPPHNKTHHAKRTTQNVTLLQAAPQMPISSTDIRQLIKSDPQLLDQSLLPLTAPVATYIRNHHLYQ